jgi:metal-responsive CopG/Arc/MetJ family transcriptional regulator
MQMERVLVQFPKPIKRKLDDLRKKGYTIAGFVRAAVEEKLSQQPTLKKGR